MVEHKSSVKIKREVVVVCSRLAEVKDKPGTNIVRDRMAALVDLLANEPGAIEALKVVLS